jgi:Ca-activated chloride channel family protein
MTPWRSCLVMFCASAMMFERTAAAQEPNVSIEPRARPSRAHQDPGDQRHANIRVNSQLVLIPVTVTDSQNRFVTGLEKEQFKLYEGRSEQVITHFASEDAPVSIGFVFDCSGSMGDKLTKSREAVAQLLRTANPDDEFSLVEFNNRAELAIPFTERSEEIQNRLTFTQSKGRTALLDAIYLSMNEMRHARNPRKALVIISDGGDNSSRYTMSEIKDRVRESDVQIYAVGIFEPLGFQDRTSEESGGPMLLAQLAEESGGQLFETKSVNEIPVITSKIGAALRNQYLLGYSPSECRNDGKYHRVHLKLLKLKGWPPLRAYWRLGYYAPMH